MKKLSKKQIVIAVCIVVAVVFVIAAIVIPFLNSQKQAKLSEIKWTATNIFEFSHYTDSDVKRITKEIGEYKATAWKEEEFIKQGVEAIEKYDISYASLSYDILSMKDQQVLLEKVGYECPEFKEAYEQRFLKTFENYASSFGFAAIAEEVITEPVLYEDKDLFNLQLSYYADPRAVFIEQFMAPYLEEHIDEVLAANNTGKLLALCKDLSFVSANTDVQLSTLLDVDLIIHALIDGAEKITVKPGEGYYADKADSSGSDFEKDEIWDEYLPGDLTHSTVNSTVYYGDLAYRYFVNQTNLTYEDSSGKTQSSTSKNHESKVIYLRGEVLTDGSIDEQYIKLAFEEGMVSYQKDKCCFAISDHAIVSFLGDGFSFEFA